MTFDTVTGELYCPKCKQSFEEGSRRFCPTDGARLVTEAARDESRGERGVFSHLLPKIGGDTGRSAQAPAADIPTFVVNEPNKLTLDDEPNGHDDEPIFEIDDAEPEFIAESEFAKTIGLGSNEPRPAARKVNPYEIPAGHVDLGDAERPGAVADFPLDSPESFVGRTVKGRYAVTELFEGDDTGYSYLADDKIVQDRKVLVRILFDQATDEVMRNILDEERISLSHFSHPNIARLIDSGQFNNGGPRFTISEYIDALSVRDISSIHGQFDASRAARVIRQAAYALGEAHQEGILHRDLRPENVILNTDGEAEQVMLINFGTSSGEPNPDNAAYKPPEVLDGRVPTIASDIFSLGVVAYEMLTSRMPFEGTTSREIVRAQYAGLTLRPTDVRPELPLAVNDVIARALAYVPLNRYTKAREFGDALFAALSEAPAAAADLPPVLAESPVQAPVPPVPAIIADEPVLELDAEPPAREPVKAPVAAPARVSAEEPAWTRRSPEPPQVENSKTKWIALVGLLVIAAVLAGLWYYVVGHPADTGITPQTNQANAAADNNNLAPPITTDIEVPPLPRKITQPPNTEFYQNAKQNLKGDLFRHFVGFSLYYPKDWKVNGPQESATINARGKFLDVSRVTPEGKLKEQMLISYYPSEGTYSKDADKFPQMVKETNETLKKLIPSYQVLSEGEIKVNGDWRAYEVKFQGGGTSDKGEKLVVWGRRLFIPAGRPGIRDGFEITMLATSLADEVRSVDDVGVHGELAAILYSFEPSQNF